MTTIRHVVFRGRVQGVGFRAFVEETAANTRVDGWVRNRRDGTVELLATGDDDAISQLIDACRQGSPAAAVTDVAVADAADDGSVKFSARPTV
jgi:acylphosphatase